MKACVYVTFKTTVLDPQGQTICAALNGLGHSSITSVRQGKFFEIDFSGSDRQAVAQELDAISRDLLSNPVIEDYRLEFIDA